MGNEKKHGLFVDLDKFNDFIDSLGLESKVKTDITKIVAYYNLKANVPEPEITENVTYIYKDTVLANPELKDKILDYIKKNKLKINLNFIEMQANEIASFYGLNHVAVENTLIGMLLSQEYKKYSEANDSKYLNRMKNITKAYSYDSMRSLIEDANVIIRNHLNTLFNTKFEYQDVVVTSDSITPEEFEERKNFKLSMIAYLLRKEVDKYEKNKNATLVDEYRNIIEGLVSEYYNTADLTYVDNETKVR